MIGAGINRIDGPLKVTGRAVYSYERQDAGEPLYGFIVGASIGKGRIISIDAANAESTPGVVLVMTYLNVPKQGRFDASVDMFARPRPVLTSDRIRYFGEPVAFVVATTFEHARAAAELITVEYQREPGAFNLAIHAARAYAPKTANVGLPTDSSFGDLDRAMREASITVDQIYTTPYHLSQAIEPPACLARWRDDRLTLYYPTQMVASTRTAIANTLLVPEERVHVDAAFVGGGFGSKLYPHCAAIFAALAARHLERPVKVAFTRRQVFSLTGHRPAMLHRVRLAASPDGRLTGIGHDVNMQQCAHEEFVEQAATVTRSLYAAPNRLTRHRATELDIRPPDAVRGPGELPGLLAVETAMDELAYTLEIDPVALRLVNDTDVDPELHVPLSGRRLGDCLREGARRFGWSRRPRRPASLREGRYLIGYGMAAGIRMHFQAATEAVVRIEADGRVIVRSDTTDIGTGTYTVVAQVAADALGVPIDRISVELARSDLPKGAGSGGSFGAPNTAVAVHRACEALKRRVSDAADIVEYNWLVQGLVQLGRFAEAATHAADGIRVAEATHHPNSIAIAHYAAGLLDLLRGDWTSARASIERPIALYRAGNAVMVARTAVCSSAWVLAQLGDGDQAESRLREGEDLVERLVSISGGATGPVRR